MIFELNEIIKKAFGYDGDWQVTMNENPEFGDYSTNAAFLIAKKNSGSSMEIAEELASKINEAKTIFWAGPLGMVEKEEYEKGSLRVAQAIIESGAFAVAGGGDLAAFLGKHTMRDKFAHVSTGGGAMLAFLAGEKLPGLEALKYGAD